MPVKDSDCRLCNCIKSIGEHEVVRHVVETKEMDLNTLVGAMAECMVFGWAIREMSRDTDGGNVLCEEHVKQITYLLREEEMAPK